jgi:glycosyltransferase involved in cell wall biosynthesis
MMSKSPFPTVLDGGRAEPATPPPDVSVVVPAFNEVETLALLAGRVRDVLDREGRTWELIIVDDGSDDGSPDVLRGLHAEDPRVRVRLLRSRHGKSAALNCGFEAARGGLIVSMDADLQDLPEEMPVLLRGIEVDGYDMVQGQRAIRSDTSFKVFASKVFNGLCSSFSGLRLHDVNCGYKAFRHNAIHQLRLGDDMHRFIPVLIHRRGLRVGEIPIRHAHRAFGQSKYGVLRYFRGFNDLFTVVLLPRLLHGVAPMLAPAGLLSMAASVICLTILGFFAASGRLGQLWELGLSSLLLMGTGLLCFALSYLDRMAFTREQVHREANVDVAETLG